MTSARSEQVGACLTRQVIECAVQWRELPETADPAPVIEALIGPIYLRLRTATRPGVRWQ